MLDKIDTLILENGKNKFAKVYETVLLTVVIDTWNQKDKEQNAF